MAMLHTVNKSPFEKLALQSCLRFARKGSSILLLEDGIYAAMKGTSSEDRLRAALKNHKVYALGPDLKARGMDEADIIDGIELVNYAEFVDLAAAHDNVQSWL